MSYSERFNMWRVVAVAGEDSLDFWDFESEAEALEAKLDLEFEEHKKESEDFPGLRYSEIRMYRLSRIELWELIKHSVREYRTMLKTKDDIHHFIEISNNIKDAQILHLAYLNSIPLNEKRIRRMLKDLAENYDWN